NYSDSLGGRCLAARTVPHQQKSAPTSTFRSISAWRLATVALAHQLGQRGRWYWSVTYVVAGSLCHQANTRATGDSLCLFRRRAGFYRFAASFTPARSNYHHLWIFSGDPRLDPIIFQPDKSTLDAAVGAEYGLWSVYQSSSLCRLYGVDHRAAARIVVCGCGRKGKTAGLHFCRRGHGGGPNNDRFARRHHFTGRGNTIPGIHHRRRPSATP